MYHNLAPWDRAVEVGWVEWVAADLVLRVGMVLIEALLRRQIVVVVEAELAIEICKQEHGNAENLCKHYDSHGSLHRVCS